MSNQAIQTRAEQLASLPRANWATALEKPAPLDFVLPGLLAGGVGLVVGAGAIGKTYLALEILRGFVIGDGVAADDGCALFNGSELGEPDTCGAILGEDPPEVIQHRLHSLAMGMRLDQADAYFLHQTVDIISGVGIDLRLIQRDAQGNTAPGPFYPLLRVFCEKKRLVVLDPLILFAGGIPENDNTGMSEFMRMLTRIAYETGCAILVLHHAGKGGAEGREDADRARGASAISTSVRLQIDLRKPSADDLKSLGVAAEDRDLYVRVAYTKHNYCAPRQAAFLQRGDGGVLKCVTAVRSLVSKHGGRGDEDL